MEFPTIKNVFSYVPTSKRRYADVTCSELIGTKSMEPQSMVNYLKKKKRIRIKSVPIESKVYSLS